MSPGSDSPDRMCFREQERGCRGGRVGDVAAVAVLSDLVSSASSASATVIRAVAELSLPATLQGPQVTKITVMMWQS